MDHSRIAALVAAATLAVGLAACGGGSSDGSSSSTPSTTQEKTSDSKGSPGALTPPGTKLKVGQEATVAWVPFSQEDFNTAQEGHKLKAGVVSIEKKSIGDLSDIELEPEEEEKTPYFVKVRLEALESDAPPADEQPALEFDAIDDRGQEATSLTILGEFPDCNSESMPEPFTNGASYESCYIFLVHSGGSIAEVQWTSGPTEPHELSPYYDDPIVWKGS